MNKNTRKILAGALVSISTLAFAAAPSFADSSVVEGVMDESTRANSYTSSLSMSANSTVTGKARSYTTGTHRITINVKSVDWHEVGNKVQIKLQKSSLGGYETVNTQMTASNMGGESVRTMGTSRSAGSYRYFFSNRVSDVGSNYSNGFYANPVKMITF